MAQWIKDLTTAAWVAAEAQVRSQAWYVGLSIQGCDSCGVGHSCCSDSIPGLGISICCRCSQKKKKKKKKKRKEEKKEWEQ